MMNGLVTELLKGAASESLGQMIVVAFNEHTFLLGVDCGQTADLKIGQTIVKLLLIEVPEHADDGVVWNKLSPVLNVLEAATQADVLARALVFAKRFSEGTQAAVGRKGISSAELITGDISLFVPGYTCVHKGAIKAAPATTSIQSLLTKRGKDMLEVMRSKPAGHRFTTQSLQLETENKSGKDVSTSVVFRFFNKLKERGLAVEMGSSGICLTEAGMSRLNEAFPQKLTDPTSVPANKDSPAMEAPPLTGKEEDDLAEILNEGHEFEV